MARDGRNLGLIQVSDRVDGNDFSADDESLLVQLAHLTAVAVENAQLISQLEEAVRIRDEFLSVASHELNTPITAATLKLQTMLKAFQRGAFNLEKGPAQVEMTPRQVKRLSQHVAALLDVSRMNEGGVVLTRTEVDLSLLVEEVTEQFRELAAATGSPLNCEVEREVVGNWDRVRLEQVVSNLVSNALKYGEGQPVDVRLFLQG